MAYAPAVLRVATVLALLCALLGAGTVGAASSSPVRISRIYYNPPGNDTQANSRLVKEYIELKNTGRGIVDLTGWRIRDVDDGKVYVFPTFKLRPGSIVRVRTGSGRDTRLDLYWGQENYVWNNDEPESATLRNRNGKVVSRCGYRPRKGPDVKCR